MRYIHFGKHMVTEQGQAYSKTKVGKSKEEITYGD